MQNAISAFQWFIVCIVLFSMSCKHEANIQVFSISEIQNPNNIPLEQTISHSGNSFASEANIGIWMFKNNHIANWLGKENDGEEVYEPINVIWIDYASESVDQTRNKIASFLSENSFSERGGSSTGYFGFIGNSDDLKKIKQYPSDKTWSDGSAVVDNNHGRTFSGTSISGNAYYTLGAFSREKGISHNFASFNGARNKLLQKGNWVDEGKDNTIKNIYHKGTINGFSTKDHDGASIFVLYP